MPQNVYSSNPLVVTPEHRKISNKISLHETTDAIGINKKLTLDCATKSWSKLEEESAISAAEKLF